MSLSPEELAAGIEAGRARCALRLWRAVEAQHVVSTMVLVDTLAEQGQLEQLIDERKPPAPPVPAGLHWLLHTPFRYPPLPGGSRFRSAADPGVWYGTEAQRTACAEVSYWRWRFLMASPTVAAVPDKPQTVFQAAVAGEAIDLRTGVLAALHADWMHPSDYGPCQRLAGAARAARLALVRYASVRDPLHEGCGALFTPAAFSARQPLVLETWLLSLDRRRAVWACTSSLQPRGFEFDAAGWIAAGG